MNVTITGADDGVDIGVLIALSRHFPFVEWGILFSESRQNEPRYPSAAWLSELCRQGHRLRLSMHLCGKYARETLVGIATWVDGWSVFQRVQVNGYTPPQYFLTTVAVRQPFEFILQVRSEEHLQAAAHEVGMMPKASILFDPSGGRGIETFKWPERPFGVRMGYAGGIKPSNVEDVLKDIGPVPDGTWVDMESGVRDGNDHLDFAKVNEVLEKVARWRREGRS